MFRPFPKAHLIASLKHAGKIAVIDRNLSPGQEGVFCEELKATLYAAGLDVPVVPFVLGLGGTNVSPSHIKKVFEITETHHESPLYPILSVEDENGPS
jgi:pyruvate ferredoxin oxidoreductase alpha subunit